MMSLRLFILIQVTGYTLSQDTLVEYKCTEDLFPKPYVILKHSKNGEEVARLETQGVIDLREAVHSYVCINGPAIVYKNANIRRDIRVPRPKGNETNLAHIADINAGETIRFTNGTFKIYNHKCMHINRIPKYEVEELEHHGKKPIVTPETTVIGPKVTGIFLVTTTDPYVPDHPPLQIMLNRKDLGYKIGAREHVIEDASFIGSGKGPFCLAVTHGPQSYVIIKTRAEDDRDICRWSQKEGQQEDKEYKKLFKRGHDRSAYEWVECTDDILEDKVEEEEEEETPKPPDYDTGPFAIFRALSSEMGGEDGSSEGNGPPEPHISSEEDDEEDEDSWINDDNITTKYHLELKDCASPPLFDPKDPLCEFAEDFNCEKLAVALELEIDPQQNRRKRDPSEMTSQSAPLALKAHPTLKWKHDVLMMVAGIFSKICVPIRKQSVYQLIHVIDNYIAKAHTANPEKSERYSHYVKKEEIWDTLISSLQHCLENEKTVPLEWEWNEKNAKGEEEDDRRRKRSLDGKEEKREIGGNPNLLFDESVYAGNVGSVNDAFDEDDRPKLIIQRSSPSFDDFYEMPNEIVHRAMPRLRRQSDPDSQKISLPVIQEYMPPAQKPGNSTNGGGERKLTYYDFMFHPDPTHLRIKGDIKKKEIFYYEDAVHHMYELNKAIDSFWKVLATVLGFCQVDDFTREKELFPLFIQNFDDYFLNPIDDQWRSPTVEEEVEMILGEFLDEDRSRWLDTCLETSYIVADALKLRPVRPMELVEITKGESTQKRGKPVNKGESLLIEQEGKKGGGDSEAEENRFVELPEDMPRGTEKYYVRE